MDKRKILITGGAGFIGSHVVRLFVEKYPEKEIFNLDALTYAGNLENLKDIEKKENYNFLKADLRNKEVIGRLFMKYRFDSVIHLAAESHVDRSISDPQVFVDTNITGTINLMEAALATWKGDFKDKLFYHISTDEVYGTLGASGLFTECSPYAPNSPYSASKAASNHFVRAYGETYGLHYVISNCSNNYGPNQFPEKLIPLFINNIIEKSPLPVYGDGKYTRDWLYVIDHAQAIDLVFHEGRNKATYNIGGFNEWQNIDLINLLCDIMDKKLDREKGESKSLISFVKDRPGHDKRYAIDASKIRNELGWSPSVNFEEGLGKTVEWYLDNPEWLEGVISGSYREYYQKQYL
ncbi:dTDP-glucose 4,6-dehydratase [Salegentibacter sp. F14]